MLDFKKIFLNDFKIDVGDVFTFAKTIESFDVYMFAGISGDYNPAHINEEESKRGMFKKRVAHGMICAGLISGAITQKINQAAVIKKQNIVFKKPVFIGDTVTIDLKVTEIKDYELNLITVALNQAGIVVAEGQVTVQFPGGSL